MMEGLVLNMSVRVKSHLDDVIKEKGIKKVWLAEKLGLSRSSITIWCKNSDNGFLPQSPNVGYALMIADLLGCKVEEIFEYEKVE